MEEEERQLWSGYGALINPPPGSGPQYGATERAPGQPSAEAPSRQHHWLNTTDSEAPLISSTEIS